MPNLELVTIIVDDYDAAIRFFSDVLGFELVADEPSLTNDGRPKRWVVVRPRRGTGLLLAQADGEVQRTRVGDQTAGRVGFFLRVDDFDAQLERLLSAGVEIVRPPRDAPYGRVAVFRDLVGNPWDLLGPREGVEPGRLIVVGGLPGAGKTTVSRLVARRLGAIYLRIDSFEQGMKNGGISQPIEGAGYIAAHAVAGDNLALGGEVVADCVNPWMLTRDEWRAVAEAKGAAFVEIEVVCSDPEEHRRRVEERAADIPGHQLPTWAEVVGRDYQPWDRGRLLVDTAGRALSASAEEILSVLRPS